nr:SAM-dependent methyltransferase [Fictibacillus nanhaiensis]
MNPLNKIGKKGDFYTSSSVSDIFGGVWADVFVQTILEHRLDPIIVEFGGGNGQFAKHVISAWEEKKEKLPLTYVVVEKSPYHRKLLQDELNGTAVMILPSMEELKKTFPSFKGIIFANEVLDAFPVRLFQKRAKSWFEKVVMEGRDGEKQNLSFGYIPIQEENTAQMLENHFSDRKEHFDLEISFQLKDWLKALYHWTKEGSVYFFVDYGYKGDQWKMESLREGSIRGYYRHQMKYNPLIYSGEMDITYHVDWDQIESEAKKSEVDTIRFETQGEFLLQNGLLSYLSNTEKSDPFSKEHKRNRAVRSFLLDSTLANGFQVIQQKKRSV